MPSGRVLAPLVLLAACGDDPTVALGVPEQWERLALDDAWLQEFVVVSDDEVRAFGGNGKVWDWRSGQGDVVLTTTTAFQVYGAVSLGADDTLLCGGGGAGGRLSRMRGVVEDADPTVWPAPLEDCAAVGDGEAFAVSDGVLVRWDGSRGENVWTGYEEMFGVWAASTDDVFIANSAGINHWDGAEMTRQFEPGIFYGIDGAAPDDVWAVGYGPTTDIVHWDGATWSASYERGSIGGTLQAVAAHRADDVWAVGDFLQVFHWDGTAWTEVELPATLFEWADDIPAFSAVAVAPSGDVWVGGYDGRGAVLVRGARD